MACYYWSYTIRSTMWYLVMVILFRTM